MVLLKHTNMSKKTECATALFLFVLGGSIYIAFRSTSLRMFGWFEILGLHEIIMLVRRLLSVIQVPEIIKYCIPDGLWTLSYILIMDAIWSSDVKKQIIFCGIIPFVGAFSEILQYLNLVEGTFDVIDLLCYIIPFIIYLIVKFKL